MGKAENLVKKEIFDYLLLAGFEDWQFWQNQAGQGFLRNYKSDKEYYTKFGCIGLFDKSVLLPDGKTLYIEEKAFNAKKSAYSRLSDKQLRFAEYCAKTNTPYIVVQSSLEVSNYLKQYFKGTQWERKYIYYA